jgi:hypothetical protein
MSRAKLPEAPGTGLWELADLPGPRFITLYHVPLSEHQLGALLRPGAFPNLKALHLRGCGVGKEDRVKLQEKFGRWVAVAVSD